MLVFIDKIATYVLYSLVALFGVVAVITFVLFCIKGYVLVKKEIRDAKQELRKQKDCETAVEPPHAEWIHEANGRCRCSNCGYTTTIARISKYCPDCDYPMEDE